jgi:hypothetical protein
MCFGPLYNPPHVKTKLQKSGGSGQVAPIDDSRMCPLQVYYDSNIHDAICVEWMAAFLFLRSMACLSISSRPAKNASSGQRNLLLNWGIAFMYYLYFLNFVVLDIF